MGRQYLIDSNAVIDYLTRKLSQKGMDFMSKVINNIPNLSVITKIEVLGYKTTSEAEQFLNDFIDDSLLFGLNDDIIEQTILIRKSYKLKTPDAIIAATAHVYNLTLITRNKKDFKDIEGLEIVNPHEILFSNMKSCNIYDLI